MSCKFSDFMFISLYLMLAVGSSAAEGLDYIDPQFGGKYVHEGSSIEETTKDHIVRSFHEFESSIDKKLYILKKEIIATLLNVIDAKITDKLDETRNQELKKMSDLSNEFNHKFDELNLKIHELENTAIDNGLMLALLNNKTVDYSNKQDLMKNVLLDNARLLNNTLEHYNRNNETCNMTKTNSLISNTLKNTTLNNSKINELKNITTALSQLNESETTEFQEINWRNCKEEVVMDTFKLYDYSKPLHPLGDVGLNHASLCKVGENTAYLHMRVGMRADHYAAIILSPEREPKDHGLLFKIFIYKYYTSLYVVTAGRRDMLKLEHATTNLSGTTPALVYIKLYNGTLELRHYSYNIVPFLVHHDDRFSSIKYFGFDSFQNEKGFATFLYDC